jgi:hypothetical protein
MNRRNHLKTARALAILLGCCGLLATAAELDFSAGVDRTTVGLGEQLHLTLTVTGSDIGTVARPYLPHLPDFIKHGSTSALWSMGSPQGDSGERQVAAFMYFLEPKRVGRLTIGPATLGFKGRVYQTAPITVTVTEAGRATRPESKTATRDVVLVSSADRESVYVGEQVTTSYVLYTESQLSCLTLKAAPGFPDFWSVPVYEDRDLVWHQAKHCGQGCNAALLKRVALFPTRSGTLTVGPMTLGGAAIVSGGIFPGVFEPFTVSSDSSHVWVKPLPDVGRPVDFCGGVGDFTLTAMLSKDRSENGEPLALEVKVSGTGNIVVVGEPPVAAPVGMKLLAPETRQETRVADNRITGTRIFSYRVIPQVDGQHIIPGIHMSFFGPKQGSYYTLRTQPLSFVATGATGASPASWGTRGVRTIGSDIAHIKPLLGRATVLNGWSAALPWWGWLFYPAGVVVFVLGLVLGRHRRRLEQDRGYARKVRSSRLVKRRLAEAGRLLASGNERGFHASLSRAVLGYVGDRFNIEVLGMTGDELRAELERRGVAPNVVTELLHVIKGCDTGRFSPGTGECSSKEILARATRVLETL